MTFPLSANPGMDVVKGAILPVQLFVLPALLLVIGFGLLRFGILKWLALRPLMTLGFGLTIGALLPTISELTAPPAAISAISQAGLAALGFFAAQQCRFSRIAAISPAAFRQAVFGAPIFLILFSLVGFVVVPGLGLLGAVVVGGAMILGGAPSIAAPLLTAPVDKDTKCSARIESATLLSVALPVAVLLEMGASPVPGGTAWADTPIFKALAGFAVGGALGLLAGRLLSVSKADLPVLPFLVALFAYLSAIYLGFHPVMTTAAAGLLYSEEVALKGEVRNRLWRTAEGLVSPLAILAFGVLFAPLIFQASFLTWVAGLATIIGARICARWIVLKPLGLASQDHSFLLWYGGAPGVASGLFLIGLLVTAAPLVDELAMSLGAVTVTLGMVITRLQSRPLTERLVQETARARKRRYRTA